jgi:hypothetical protein
MVPGRATNNRPVLARVLSAALIGVVAVLVRVEIDVVSGLPAFTTGACPTRRSARAASGCASAIRNAGFGFPSDHITVNLAAANIRKDGASFDLPIALGILAATGARERRPPRALRRRRRAGPGRPATWRILDRTGRVYPFRGTLNVWDT